MNAGTTTYAGSIVATSASASIHHHNCAALAVTES